MWNPLRLPLIAVGMALDAARVLADLPRMLEAIADRGDAVLAELERLNGLVESLSDQVALLQADVRELRGQIADSAALEAQLERTQAQLAEANRQIGRMVETTASPDPQPEPATPERRRGRFGAAFRRSSPA